MGAETDRLNSKLGIDTTDFKTGLASANRELRVLESGFRASVSTLEDWGNSVTGLELRQKNLNSQIDIQRAKVEALREEHQRLADAHGETSISAKTAEVNLNKETERLGKMQIELDGTVIGLKNLNNGNDAAGRSTKELMEKQQSLGQQFKKSWTEINSAIMVGKEAYRAIKQVVNETVGTFVSYAGEVREISQVTGQQAEDVSRLLQLTDDYKIKSESLTTVMKKMATEGFAFTTDALADLSDEYLKLESGVERQLFLNEKFGKKGVDFAEIMLQGGDAIRSQSSAISGHLVLTQAALDKAREYELANDALTDSWEAYKVSIGEDITPILTGALNIQNTRNRAEELGINLINYRQLSYKTTAVLLKEIAEAEKERADAEEKARIAKEAEAAAFAEANQEIDGGIRYLKDYSDVSAEATTQATMFGFAVEDGADALQQANEEFSFIISFARQYETNLKNITSAEEDLKTAEEELFAMSQPGWDGTADQVQAAQDKVDGLKTRLEEARQASLDATNEMIAGFLQAQLSADGSFTEEDIQKVLKYRLAVGLLTQEAYEAALEALKIAKNLASIPDEVNTNINVNTNYTSSGVKPGVYSPNSMNAVPQAEGGDWLVTKPTLFLAGEAGIERATFTPINSGMKSAVDQFEDAVRGIIGGLTPANAGAGSAFGGQDRAPISITIEATVANDMDIYEMSRKVADEIRRNR